MTKVSVIIPTWNRANTITKAIYSALSQTIPPIEILVCDDGSTDNTRELVYSLSIGNPQVKWFNGPRGGRPAIPRNRGIAESIGDWLAFLDSDDEWMPNKLEKEIEVAGKLGLKAACSNAKRLISGNLTDETMLTWNSDKLSFFNLIKQNSVICSSAIIHRSLLTHVIGFPECKGLTALEDYALWLRVATQTDFAFVREPLLIYSDDPETSIRNGGGDFLSQQNQVLRNFIKWGIQGKIGKSHLQLAKRKYFVNHIRKILPF